MRKSPSRDVLVIGAGVFGAWTARSLRDAGVRASLLDARPPDDPTPASRGESRITRCMYGAERLYTDWARESVAAWRSLSERAAEPLFHETGVLWLHGESDAFAAASRTTLAAAGVPFEALGPRELGERYPLIRSGPDDRALLEPRAGALRADAALRVLVSELAADGVELLRGRVRPVRATDGRGGRLAAVETDEGERLEADAFVLATGPWLERLCPDALGGRLFVTRQEVLFFEVGDAARGLPVWADMPFYGFPPLGGVGFKIACDRHGPRVAEVEGMDREVGVAAIEEARAFLARRFPSLADAPYAGGRVCQYANSWNGDFLVDRHPGLDNAWLVGAGSGHGYKHGPALGAHVTGRILGREAAIERFSLRSKRGEQARSIQ